LLLVVVVVVVGSGSGVVVVIVDDNEDIISWFLLSSSSFLALAMIRLVGGDNDKNYLDTCGLVDCRMHNFYFSPLLSPTLASRS